MKKIAITFVDDNGSDCPLYSARPNGLPPLAFLNIPFDSSSLIEVRANSLRSCSPQLASDTVAKICVPGDLSRRALLQLEVPNSPSARLVLSLAAAHNAGNRFRFNNIFKSIVSNWKGAEKALPIEIHDFWKNTFEKFDGEFRFFLPGAKSPRVLRCEISDAGLCIFADLMESTDIWRNRTVLVLGDCYEFLYQLRDELRIDAEIGRGESVVGR